MHMLVQVHGTENVLQKPYCMAGDKPRRNPTETA